jgi:adenylate cyclase class IV
MHFFQIKLVPLLLEGWKEMYPDTSETVKTFQTRIKHLSQQKEIIKRQLGLLRAQTVEKEEEPFKWNKNMIQVPTLPKVTNIRNLHLLHNCNFLQ